MSHDLGIASMTLRCEHGRAALASVTTTAAVHLHLVAVAIASKLENAARARCHYQWRFPR
jgi:hypothetical protein